MDRPADAEGVRLIYTRVGRWFDLPAPFYLRTGEVTQCAVLDGELSAFFRGGAYFSFSAQGTRVGLKLPGGHVPLALAGDRKNYALVALVPARIVLRVN